MHGPALLDDCHACRDECVCICLLHVEAILLGAVSPPKDDRSAEQRRVRASPATDAVNSWLHWVYDNVAENLAEAKKLAQVDDHVDVKDLDDQNADTEATNIIAANTFFLYLIIQNCNYNYSTQIRMALQCFVKNSGRPKFGIHK